MSEAHREKRSFLHSTSDTDSDLDVEHEQGWGDVRLTNKFWSGSYGAPRYSYITHDFTTFRAPKVNPVPREIVPDSRNLLRNEDLENAQMAEWNSMQLMKERSTFSSNYRPQESIPRPVASGGEIHGDEVGIRNKNVGSSTPQKSSLTSVGTDIDPLGQGADKISVSDGENDGTSSIKLSVLDANGLREEPDGRNTYIGLVCERWSLVQPLITDVDTVGKAASGRIGHLGSHIDRRPSGNSSVSGFDILEEAGGGSEMWSSVKLRDLDDDDTLREIRDGRNSYVGSGSEKSSLLRPPLSDGDILEEAAGEKNSYTGNGIVKRPSIESPVSAVDIMGEALCGRNKYVNSGSEERPSTRPPFSDIVTLGEEICGRKSYLSSGSESRAPVESAFSKIDTYGQEVGSRNNYVGGEKRPFVQSLSSDIDIDDEEDGARSSHGGNGIERRPSAKSLFSDTDRLREGADGTIGNVSGGDERRLLGQSLFSEIDLIQEAVCGGSSYMDSGNERQSSLKSPMSNPYTLGEEVDARKSYTGDSRERQSLGQSRSDIDLVGKEVSGRPSHVGSGKERFSSLKSPLSDSDILGEEVGESYVGGGSKRGSSAQVLFSEIDLQEEEVSGIASYLGSGNERQPSMQTPFSKIEVQGEEVTGRTSFLGSGNERPSSLKSPWSDSDILGEEVGARDSYVGGGRQRKSSAQSSFSGIDLLGEDVGGRTSNIDSGHKKQPAVPSPFLETNTLDEKDGGRKTYMGSEKQSSVKSPLSIIDIYGEDTRGRNSYISDGSRSWPLLHSTLTENAVGVRGKITYTSSEPSGQSPLSRNDPHRPDVERTTYLGSGVEMKPVMCIDTIGEEHGGRTSYIDSDRERWSLVKSPLLNSDTLLEEVSERNSYVVGGSERQSSARPNSFDSDRLEEESDRTNNYINSGGARWASVKEPLLDEGQPDPLSEITRASVNLSRQVSRMSPVSDSHKQVEVGGRNSSISSHCGNERRLSLKDQVLDEESEIKRVSLASGRKLSYFSPPSDTERDPDSPLERVRARGSVGQSSRWLSHVALPNSEAESEVKTRERDEYGEADTTATTAQQPPLQRRNSLATQVGERVPPEWALLLIGCLLGLATGLSVVTFNKVVHVIHDIAWAGTPHEGAAWLRLQKLIDIWHRVMLIPVVGGVLVGLMHAFVGILDQVKGSRPPTRKPPIDWLAAMKPTVKAGQAMVTLGTGCSLGPEGPSVDIGKAWAHGLATIMKNNRERRIALVAAGAAAGISAGFNAPVSGMFFAIETVLRPQHAENSPPLTTAMIILASIISSTVSQVLLEETAAFTVPIYELRSAAELPLYLLLGGVCGVVSVIFKRLTAYFTDVFEFLRDWIGVPHTVTPAIGGLVTGLVALKYPGVLYWGFSNVDEILHSGKTATAPGAGLVTQLICAKVFATAFCKGSGLVGGVYAPSLFIGAAVGSVYGTIAGKIINAAIPGHETVAHPQAYALVGMAALLAAVCSVPLTSVLLLFELTKDYHILLPLMGGIGVAIWVDAVAKQSAEKHFASSSATAGRSLIPSGTREDGTSEPHNSAQLVWRWTGNGTEVELCTLDGYEGPDMVSDDELMGSVKVSQAMSNTFVKVQPIATVKETIRSILRKQQRCALVVDENDLIEGIFTFYDLESEVMRAAEASAKGDRTVVEVDKMLVAAFCSGKGDNQGQDTDLVVCFPDMSLKVAQGMMDSSGFKQLPVVTRAGRRWQDEGRQIVGLIERDAIPRCIREEASKRIIAIFAKNDEDDNAPLLDTH